MIGIITQARLGSTRLPGKILKEINGITLLQYHLNRLNHANQTIIVATTTEPQDDQVASFCEKKQINYFRGSQNNVLERFYLCAKQFNLNTIVRVTSDCPLIDGELIKKAIAIYNSYKKNNVYLSNTIDRTFPRGFDFEIFSLELLKNAYENATEDFEKEHVTPYLWNKPLDRNISFHQYLAPENNSEYRITVDTEEDFKLVHELISRFNAYKLDAESIINIMKQHPELAIINQHIEQKKVI